MQIETFQELCKLQQRLREMQKEIADLADYLFDTIMNDEIQTKEQDNG